MCSFIVCMLLGAGKFNEEDVKELKSVCRLACDKVSNYLNYTYRCGLIVLIFYKVAIVGSL